MTEALKRMAEAMAAEIVRQANECAWVEADVDSRNAYLVRIGYEESGGFSLDVEKVARAGLEALAADYEREAEEIGRLQASYLSTMSGAEAERLDAEIQARSAGLRDLRPMIGAILGRPNI